MTGRTTLTALVAALAISCGGGKGTGDAESDQDSTPDTDAAEDTQSDPGADPDPDPDAAGDTDDTGSEYDTTDPGHMCGNLVVEPGEDCDPPYTTTRCTTPCGTIGEGDCTPDCLAPDPVDCEPPAESCNFEDDDCDGMIDEGTMTGWSPAAVLSSEDGASAALSDVAWTGDVFAAAWVVEPAAGPPDSIHLAILDPIGNTLMPDMALALAAGDVIGRPGIAWTGSTMMVAWGSRDSGDFRNVAILDAGGDVVSTGQASATGLGPSTDVAWAASHAAVVWVEEVTGDPEVMIGFAGSDGTPEGLPVRITAAAGAASSPVVDADDSAILVAWVDARTGTDELRRAVLAHDGSIIAADAAIPSSSGGSSPAVSIAHGIVAWIDPGAGTPAARATTLDASWEPAATPVDVSPAGSLALASAPGRLLAALGGDFATLGADGAIAGSPVALGADAVPSLAWGVISAAGVGASPPGGPPEVLLALAGCPQHDGCTAWAPGMVAIATRTGWVELAALVVHDAATSGSWTSRPVTYLSIQMFQAGPRDGPDIPGGYLLTGVPYESCGLCVLFYENCGASTCERTYLARGGQLDLESIGPAGTMLAGALVDVQLAEVTIDSSDGSSSWVPGGREICLGGYEFSEIIAPY